MKLIITLLIGVSIGASATQVDFAKVDLYSNYKELMLGEGWGNIEVRIKDGDYEGDKVLDLGDLTSHNVNGQPDIGLVILPMDETMIFCFRRWDQKESKYCFNGQAIWGRE
jgi:hypothetical protein